VPLPEGSSRAAALLGEDRSEPAPPTDGFGSSLAEKLRGAIKSSQKS
jgi:hypothetical protein